MMGRAMSCSFFFFFQAEDGIRDVAVTGVQRVLFRSAADAGTALGSALLAAGAETARVHCARRGVATAEEKRLLWESTDADAEIGRASCRERVEISVGAVSLKKKRRSTGGRGTDEDRK